MQIEQLTSYEIIEKRRIEDLNSMSYLLRHKKTGARVALLSNDDENKVFYIGFRTPPEDSTGVAHILEHSVLCGSEKYPVKDPFVELVKGSLNTFLNAMTYPDKTVYPLASCNDTDFQNLCNVYLDAVFHPNIYKEKKIFMQEGWHYEMEDENDDLTLNGVVYNEMKGAFSSPDDVLYRQIMTSLYPDNTYSTESGGDPKNIPDLTYEQFLEFHSRYYHPSNSYIYLYGNMDMAEKLDFIDREYLSKYDYLEIDSSIKTQSVFESMREMECSYPITEEESEKDNTYLAYNIMLKDSLDEELSIAFSVLDYAICSAPGAPLKQALIDKGIGKDVYSMYEDGIKQPYFSVVAKNANVEQKEEFTNTIHEVLKGLLENGLDKKALRAGLNYYEFKYREADFGSYPKGLMYGLRMLDSWLYDDSKPFIHVEANDTYKAVKEKIDTDYFEQLIRTYLLDNSHKSLLILKPEKGLGVKEDEALAKKLAEYKASLSKEQIQKIVEDTQALKEYQEAEEKPEDLAKIPLLKREDLKKEAEMPVNDVRKSKDTTILFHDIFTNHIGYLRLVFDLENVPAKLFPYLGILKAVLGLMDTENYSYGDLYNEMNIQTGGMSVVSNIYTNNQDISKQKVTLEVKAKVLYENLDKAFALATEIMTGTKFADEKRLREIMEELNSKNQAAVMSAGHSFAMGRAMSYQSKSAAISEVIGGMDFNRFVEKIAYHFEEEKETLIECLTELTKCIFRPENLMVDYTATEDGYEKLPKLVEELKEKLYNCPVETGTFEPEISVKNEGFTSSSQVQYVGRAGNYRKKGLEPTGSLKVLKVMMGYEYLWVNVRVKGGAYGCMSGFGKTGDSYFVSYRDPNLAKTVDVYEKAADFIANFQADERTMTQFVIGAVSDMDVPMNPAAKGTYSLGAYLTDLSNEAIQKERDELLATSAEDIRRLSVYIKAFMEDDCFCVIGNEEKIKESADMFKKVEPLFR